MNNPTSKFVQILSDPKLGLVALAADGTVWRWRPESSDAGGRYVASRWEKLG